MREYILKTQFIGIKIIIRQIHEVKSKKDTNGF